jgi:hypothetical protein
MLGYHGTSADNLESIKREGLKAESDTVWTCSQYGTYFWGDNYVECEGLDDVDPESYLLEQALDSSIFPLSYAKDCRPIIVVFEVPDNEVETDESCEHMEHANFIPRDISVNEIKKILVGPDLGLLRAYFINIVLQRNEINTETGVMVDRPFSQLEKGIARQFNDFYFCLQEHVYPEDFDVVETIKSGSDSELVSV